MTKPHQPYILTIGSKKCENSRDLNMSNKQKHRGNDGQETNVGQYPFLALLFHIQENVSIALLASKHNTSTCLLQETCYFYWQNTLTHKCPKRCQPHGMLDKRIDLNNIICFRMKFKFGPYSNSEINLVIQPSELIKKHAQKCPISGADHLHVKMFQPQTTSLGSSHTHVIARKACYSTFIINYILSHLHGCANSCHEISSTLSMDNGSMHSAIGQCHSHSLALHFYHPDMHFPHSCLSSRHNLPYWQHSLQPHSEGGSLPPPHTPSMLMDAKECCHPEESNMISQCKHTKEDGQETNARQYIFLALLFHIPENPNSALTMSKHNKSTCFLQETCSFYWQNALMCKCPQRCQSHGMDDKPML